MKSKGAQEKEIQNAALQKVLDQCMARIQTIEAYVHDKMNDSKSLCQKLEKKMDLMASLEMLDKVHENEKTMKANNAMEFDRFQQYLKDGSNRSSKLDQRIREIELQLRPINEVGGFIEVRKLLEKGEDNKNKDDPMNLTAKSNTLTTQNLNATGGVDPRVLKDIQNMLVDNKNQIEQILDMLDDKVERREVETMISTKASKDDITELLPDMRLYEEKVTSQIEESIEDL